MHANHTETFRCSQMFLTRCSPRMPQQQDSTTSPAHSSRSPSLAFQSRLQASGALQNSRFSNLHPSLEPSTLESLCRDAQHTWYIAVAAVAQFCCNSPSCKQEQYADQLCASYAGLQASDRLLCHTQVSSPTLPVLGCIANSLLSTSCLHPVNVHAAACPMTP